jgi:hypothetical protein
MMGGADILSLQRILGHFVATHANKKGFSFR